MSERLNGIRVEGNPVFFCYGTEFPDRLNCADLIVAVHNGNQYRIIANGRTKGIGADYAVLVDVEISNLKSLILQMRTGVENCVMLDLACDDVLPFSGKSLCSRFQSPVVR